MCGLCLCVAVLLHCMLRLLMIVLCLFMLPVLFIRHLMVFFISVLHIIRRCEPMLSSPHALCQTVVFLCLSAMCVFFCCVACVACLGVSSSGVLILVVCV